MNLTLWSYCASFTAVIESSSQSAGEERESSPRLMLNHGTNLHRTLPKTHVPAFRGMVVTYPLLNKANFLIKQETIWCCIYSFLLTPALCVFWNHTIIHQWHRSFSDEETGIYCTVLWCTPRATCHVWSRETLPFTLRVDPGFSQLDLCTARYVASMWLLTGFIRLKSLLP